MSCSAFLLAVNASLGDCRAQQCWNHDRIEFLFHLLKNSLDTAFVSKHIGYHS